VKLVKKNDESLLLFEADLVHVIPAENVILDAVSADVRAIGEELRSVLEIVRDEAQRLEEAGALQKMSLSELVEQKTMVHHIGQVPQFNKMSHLTGRTPMERYILNAKVACEQASESIDSVQKKYAMVLEYFGEDDNMGTADFFGILRRFMAEWKKAVEQVNKIEKAQVGLSHTCRDAFKQYFLIFVLLFQAKEKKRAAAREAKKRSRKSTQAESAVKKTLTGESANASKDQSLQENIPLSDSQQGKARPPACGVATLVAEHTGNGKQNHAEHAIHSVSTQKQQVAKDKKDGVNHPVDPQPSTVVGIASRAFVARERDTSAGSGDTDGGNDNLIDHSISNQLVRRDRGEAESTFSPKEIGSKANTIFPSVTDAADNYAQKTPKDRGNSKFLSSLSAYRKNKRHPQSKSLIHSEDQIADDANMSNDPQSQVTASCRPLVLSIRSEEANSPSGPPLVENPIGDRLSKVDTDFSSTSDSRRDNPCGVVALPRALGKSSATLDSFLEMQKARETRAEVLLQNHDDSSVAILAENFEKQAIASSGSDDTWDNVGGISDFLGWANVAIRESDTESVRGFVDSQNLDDNQDFDDESTIASAFFDDDTSVVSGVVTPRQIDVSYFDDYQTIDEPEHREKSNFASLTAAKVAASILFSDSETESSSVDNGRHQPVQRMSYGDVRRQNEWDDEVMDTALSYDDAGLDQGLSFGTDVGFDDGLGFGSQGGDDIVWGGFAESSTRPNYSSTISRQPMINTQLASLSSTSSNEAEDKKKIPPTSKWFGGWGKGT
jgi:hypothetical protein